MYRSARARERNLNTPLWPGNYRLGMWIWLGQRLSGLGLAGYVLMHLFVISFSMAGPGGKSFTEVMKFLQAPAFIILEIILMAAVLYHALNGIRILLFDVGIGVRHQKEIFLVALAVGFVAWAIGAYFLLPYALGKPMF